MPTSVRLDQRTEQLLDRVAARGESRSAIIREAIRRLAVSRARPARRTSFAQRIADSIGILKDGDPALSTETGARFTRLLRARRTQEAIAAKADRPTKGRGARRQRDPR